MLYSATVKHSFEKAMIEILIGLSTITGGVKIAVSELEELVAQTVKATDTIKKAKGAFDPDVVKNQFEHALKVNSYFAATPGADQADPVSVIKDQVHAIITEPAYKKQLTNQQISAFSDFYHTLSVAQPKTLVVDQPSHEELPPK